LEFDLRKLPFVQPTSRHDGIEFLPSQLRYTSKVITNHVGRPGHLSRLLDYGILAMSARSPRERRFAQREFSARQKSSDEPRSDFSRGMPGSCLLLRHSDRRRRIAA
jgi:hypothetical protein